MLPSGVTFKVGNQDYSSKEDLKLRVSDTTPGGFSSCTFELCDGTYPQWGAKVSIYDSNYRKSVFVGRVTSVTTKGSMGCSVTAKRQTTNQRFIEPNDFPANSGVTWAAGRKIYDAIIFGLTITPDVFDGGIVDPGIQFIQTSKDFMGQTAEDLWNELASLTTQLSTPLLWWIWGEGETAVLTVSFLDTGVRYRILGDFDLDQLEQIYDLEAVTNRSTVEWGKDQVITTPNVGGGESLSYEATPIIRDKYTNASNQIGTHQEALSLATNYIGRFGEFRSTRDIITLECDKNSVRALPPVSGTIPVDGYPLHLIRSGNYIDVGTLPQSMSPYTKQYKLIVSKDYDFDSGKLTLTCGEIVTFDSQVTLIQDFNVNRLFNAGIQSVVNEPYANADAIPVYGPQYDGIAPPSFGPGIPTMVVDKDNPTLVPNGAVVHPNLVADEGLEANIVVGDIGTTGLKPGVRIIPGEFNNYEIVLGNDSGLLVGSDLLTITFLKLADDGVTLVPLIPHPITTTSARKDETISPSFRLGRKEWIFPRVDVAATVSTWASISFHGKRQYPGLRV